MPNCFGGGTQGPALRTVMSNFIKIRATKKNGYKIRPFKRPPEIPRVARPFGVRLRPARVILSDASCRAVTRHEASRTAKRHRAKRRWNLGRDSAQDDAGGCTPNNNYPFSKPSHPLRGSSPEGRALKVESLKTSLFKSFCGVLGGFFQKAPLSFP